MPPKNPFEGPSIPLADNDAGGHKENYMQQERKAMEGKEKHCPKCGSIMMEQESELGSFFICPKDGRMHDQEKTGGA